MNIREEFREYLRESRGSSESSESKYHSNNAHIKIYCDDADIIIAEINKNKSLNRLIEKLEKFKYGLNIWLWATDEANYKSSLRKFKNLTRIFDDIEVL